MNEDKKPRIVIQISPEEIPAEELTSQLGKALTIVCAGILKAQMKTLNKTVDDFIKQAFEVQGMKVEIKEEA